VAPLSEAALQALFAPYCGGLSRASDLMGALQLLQRGSLQGRRAVEGSAGHRYSIRWEEARSPLEPVACSLRFDNHADLLYEFQLQTHQLVSWLMDCSKPADGDLDLPDAFWHWLLLGEDPSA
jgi:hypothetical protein